MTRTTVATEMREGLPTVPNPLGMCGIEFIEFRTRRPQSLGRVLEAIGFRPVARHRSREVLLYRQAAMNVVVDAHAHAGEEALSSQPDAASISAVAFRVHDAPSALARCLDLGAWEVASHAQAMELHLPGIRGPGASRFYFIDRWQDFSIYDVDFRPLTGLSNVASSDEAADLRWFGCVQYVGWGRSADWVDFYAQLLGFTPLPEHQRFGVLPRGILMRSACGQFYWQIIEPQVDSEPAEEAEALHRMGIGTTDVLATVRRWRERGIGFVETDRFHPNPRGALTQRMIAGVEFELVQTQSSV